jgi:hypothetical protein
MQRPKMVLTEGTRILLKALAPLLLIALLVLIYKPNVHAVPSYSRQTGMPCATCHYAPPELTPFGRKFKLEGYTFTTKATVSDDGKDHNAGLKLLEAFPLSIVFDTSFTSTKAPQPGTQNGNFQFPQDASLFLAGAWGSHVGSFLQVTYDGQSNSFGWDNTDIRFANSNGKLFGKSLTYGATLNNNPTVEDLWNSTPAWGFPFVSSSAAPTPTASALINGGLAQDVAGAGGYAMWNDHIYVVGTIYRSEHLGGSQPNPGTDFGINIRGIAPYWRLAYQTSNEHNSLMIGTYGIHVKSSPNEITVGGFTDSYTDWAADFQYDHIIPQLKNDTLSLRGTYIRENSSLAALFSQGGASQARHHLDTVQLNAEYHFGTKLSGTAGFFNLSGTTDQGLYGPAAVSGSLNGSPHSNGYILNLSWWPQQNINFSVQYNGYLRFNGGQNDYDGSLRAANGNNTVFLLGRFVF